MKVNSSAAIKLIVLKHLPILDKVGVCGWKL